MYIFYCKLYRIVGNFPSGQYVHLEICPLKKQNRRIENRTVLYLRVYFSKYLNIITHGMTNLTLIMNKLLLVMP